MTIGKTLVTGGKTLVTNGKTLVTKAKTLVKADLGLVTKRKALVIEGKPLATMPQICRKAKAHRLGQAQAAAQSQGKTAIFLVVNILEVFCLHL